VSLVVPEKVLFNYIIPTQFSASRASLLAFLPNSANLNFRPEHQSIQRSTTAKRHDNLFTSRVSWACHSHLVALGRILFTESCDPSRIPWQSQQQNQHWPFMLLFDRFELSRKQTGTKVLYISNIRSDSSKTKSSPSSKPSLFRDMFSLLSPSSRISATHYSPSP